VSHRHKATRGKRRENPQRGIWNDQAYRLGRKNSPHRKRKKTTRKPDESNKRFGLGREQKAILKKSLMYLENTLNFTPGGERGWRKKGSESVSALSNKQREKKKKQKKGRVGTNAETDSLTGLPMRN